MGYYIAKELLTHLFSCLDKKKLLKICGCVNSIYIVNVHVNKYSVSFFLKKNKCDKSERCF